MIRVGVDVGGTFTDLVMMDDSTGSISIYKTSSTPNDTSIGVTDGLLELCKVANVPPSSVDLLFYGTTEATNIVVEHKGATIGMITTKGFRDIVHIGRQKRYYTYSILVDQPWQKHPLVKRRHRHVVSERIDSSGKVLVPLEENETIAAVKKLKNEGAQAIAVCFLNSYRNPVHEQRVKELISEVYPKAHVSLSHEIVNQYREYERFSTTCLNAYIAPIVSKHIENLEGRLASNGVTSRLMLMQSNGGTATTTWAARKPVSLLMSGPAAGLIAGIKFAELADIENIITIDVGGTTADLGVAPRRALRYKHLLETRIKGYATMLPMLDMDTIGAGGGSIVYVDEGGAFRVGPMSAGAKPGPACYGLGGIKPTVTDAHMITRRLNAKYFLGGRLKVYPEKSETAFREHICASLRMGLEEAALGAIKISNHNMIQALELNITGRGFDPRDFALMAFGGAGPLHGCEIARQLGIPLVIIPPLPGITSAIGLLLSDILYSESMTVMQNSMAPDLNNLSRGFATMEKEVLRKLEEDGFGERGILLQRFAECRYVGQSYELRVQFDSGQVNERSVKKLMRRFDQAHQREYSLSFPGRHIEIVHIHAVGVGKITAFHWKKIARAGNRSTANARKEEREAIFDVRGKPKWVRVNCYERNRLKAGNIIRGPGIVEQPDSTSIIEFGCTAKVDTYGNMIVRVKA